MKKFAFIAFTLFLSILFSLPAHSETQSYDNFLLTLSEGGWNDKDQSLIIRVAAIICSKAGVCMVNGYGAEAMEDSLMNFNGNILNDGTYLHVWLKGDGRGTTIGGTVLVSYDIYVKIDLKNPVDSKNNTFNCAVSTNNASDPYVTNGNVTVSFY